MSMIRFWSSPVLDNPPDCFTAEEQAAADAAPSIPTVARQYDALIRRHGPHPFFLVQLGLQHRFMNSQATSIALYRQHHQAQAELAKMGINDPKLDSWIESRQTDLDKNVQTALEKSKTDIYFQTWKPAREHKFPLQAPILPSGHDQVKDDWEQMFPQGSSLFKKYLSNLAIETNHVESTFLITVGSTQDLIRRGITDGIVDTLPQSSIHDAPTIKGILNDTLAAYELLPAVVADPSMLTPDLIRNVHARLMETSRFSETYTPPGWTRTWTRKTVIIAGNYKIQCCPFPEVDNELDYICKMAKQYIKNWRNPFATASWIHLLLARCHPFNDGNGRTTRLIASIPLMMHGYPPISIGLTQRSDYYNGINKAYDGDHGPLIQCILRGMEATIASVRSI